MYGGVPCPLRNKDFHRIRWVTLKYTEIAAARINILFIGNKKIRAVDKKGGNKEIYVVNILTQCAGVRT